MRQIGTRAESQPSRLPTAAALRLGAIHQKTGGALAALATTGVAKGIYRFRSYEEKNRHKPDGPPGRFRWREQMTHRLDQAGDGRCPSNRLSNLRSQIATSNWQTRHHLTET